MSWNVVDGCDKFRADCRRYANRIKNGTFTVDGTEYKVTNNEHDGQNQLHGGFVGYDRESWTVSAHNTSSITFTWFDAAGTEGFPGSVVSARTINLCSR